jgi:signal transduction histidine kinase
MRFTTLLRRRAGDLLVVALAVFSQLEFWLGSIPEPRAGAAFGVAAALPLLARRRYPFAAPLIVVAVVVVTSFVAPRAEEEGVTIIVALILAMWALGLRNERTRAVMGGVLAIAAAQIVNRNFEEGLNAADVLFTVLLVWAPLIAGQALRHREQRAAELEARAERLAREREERARTAVAEERARVARELHDVVAHSISVMTIQAGAARLLIDDDPLRADGPLQAVEDTGRQTLAELRSLVGVLHAGELALGLAPQPGLDDLPALAESVRAAGLPVVMTVDGEPEGVPPGVDLTAYRIVQEALTNTLKHAGPASARVTVRYRPGSIDLEILDDGAAAGNGRAGGGHGLVGMRERVALYGGELQAGTQPGGGFAIRARLPLEAVA